MLGAITFNMVAALAIEGIWGLDPMSLDASGGPTHIQALKLMVLLGTGLGAFLLPTILASILLFEDPLTELGLRTSSTSAITYLLGGVAVLFSLPLVNFMVLINEQMHLPEAFQSVEQWMIESEAQLKELTEAMLNMGSFSDLAINLFIIAIIPALAEELLFRGLLQRLFLEFTKNKHAAIWISAILFSAIHMQFYGFIPRMLLGVMFGYLLVWTGNIWVPILAHFVNNGFAVLAAYFMKKGEDNLFDENTVGQSVNDWWILLLSAGAVGYCLFRLYRSSKNGSGLEHKVSSDI
ncbi:MAG: lysostaphin resistance A-like protein [Bacteroidota bacterium]|jgi:membrane protease YdiL (CAAX protease family)